MEKVLNRYLRDGLGIRLDRRNYAFLIVIMTLAVLILVIGSIALWLFAFNYIINNAEMANLTIWLIVLGLVAIATSLLVGLGISVETYSLIRACKVSFCTSFVLLTLLFWIVTFSYISVIETISFSMGLLVVIIGIVAGATLGLLPSLLGSIIAWFIRQIILIVKNR